MTCASPAPPCAHRTAATRTRAAFPLLAVSPADRIDGVYTGLAAVGDTFLATFATNSELHAIRFSRASGLLDDGAQVVVAKDVGEVEDLVATSDGQRYVVAWRETRPQGALIRVVRVAADGKVLDARPIDAVQVEAAAEFSVAAEPSAIPARASTDRPARAGLPRAPGARYRSRRTDRSRSPRRCPTMNKGFPARHAVRAILPLALVAALASGCGDNPVASEPAARVFLVVDDGSGNGGTFLSDDLGSSWEPTVNPATNDVAGPAFPIFAFVSRNVGFSVTAGGEGASRTSDGGRSWERRPGRFPLRDGGQVGDLAFVDPVRGIAIATTVRAVSPGSSQSTGDFFYTTDAGDTWSRADLPADGVAGGLDEVCTTASGLGVALGRQIISRDPRPPVLMATGDAGRTWRSALDTYPGKVSPRQIACVGEATVWVAGVSELFTSHDGGLSFEDRTADLPAEVHDLPIEGIQFVDELHGVLLAGSDLDSRQRLVVTADGGDRWQALLPPGPLSQILFLSDGVALVDARAATDALFLTRDAGRSWLPVGLPSGFTYVDEIRAAVGR